MSHRPAMPIRERIFYSVVFCVFAAVMSYLFAYSVRHNDSINPDAGWSREDPRR